VCTSVVVIRSQKGSASKAVWKTLLHRQPTASSPAPNHTAALNVLRCGYVTDRESCELPACLPAGGRAASQQTVQLTVFVLEPAITTEGQWWYSALRKRVCGATNSSATQNSITSTKRLSVACLRHLSRHSQRLSLTVQVPRARSDRLRRATICGAAKTRVVNLRPLNAQVRIPS
jgi:hypothetical protein